MTSWPTLIAYFVLSRNGEESFNTFLGSNLDHLKPATGRPYVPAFSLSGTVPAFTCDCLRFVCAFTQRRKFDGCLSTFLRTMFAFGNNVSCWSSAHVLLLRFVVVNMDVNTPASKRSQLIGNIAIVRKRCVIHKKSTCVCLRFSVAAFTRKRMDARFDLWLALDEESVAGKMFLVKKIKSIRGIVL